MDLDLISAINGASPESAIMSRLELAMPFFSAANTCSDDVSESTEVIMMAAAFEQLLKAKGQNGLAYRLGELLDEYLWHTVADIEPDRGKINAEVSQDDRAHRAWIKEMYRTRNEIIHDDYKEDDWAWSVKEHLVIAAVVFPLIAKLLLGLKLEREPCLEVEKHLYSGGKARLQAEVLRTLRDRNQQV